MNLGMILDTREECVEKHSMGNEEAEWIFGKVTPYQEKPDGTPEYLPCDVEMAEKAWAMKHKPDHDFFSDPANGGAQVGTAYVARRLMISQTHVHNLIAKHASLQKTILGRAAKARVKFHKAKVDKWIDKYLKSNRSRT